MRDLLGMRRAFVVRYSEHWAEVLGEVRQRRLCPCYAVSPCYEHAQPLQMPDDSADESDPADNVDDADTENATTETAGSVAASSEQSG